MASVRYERRISVPADQVWALVGDPARIVEWFPGVLEARVVGDRRTLRLATGVEMPERILAADARTRHVAYRLETDLVGFHLGTIDVFELGPSDTLVVYATTAEPDTMALVIGGATDEALDAVVRLSEGAGG